MAETPNIEALLENATWLRALAHSLLADRGLADDALQETWMAALRERPVAGSERPWLARVLRNFARQRGRAEAARSARERRTARSEQLPGSDEVVERAELHARLVQAVLALEEPHRSTLLWRYFEGLSAEEIARRAKIEPATVRSRVARARERLRASLTANGGDAPERWLTALLPFGARWEPIPTGVAAGVLAALGGSLMNAKLIVGVVSIAVLALWLARGVWSEPELAQAPASSSPSASAEEASDDPLARDELALPSNRRPAAPLDSAKTVAATSARAWNGVVLSEDGRAPIEGARITYRRGSEIASYTPEEAKARSREGAFSDKEGRFALEIPGRADEGLWIEADGHFPCKLSGGDLPRESRAPIEIVLAPLGTLELEVVEADSPRAGLAVKYRIEVNRGSQDHMWSYRREISAGATDESGLLTIKGVPCGMPVQLQPADPTWPFQSLGSVHVDPHTRFFRQRVELTSTATLIGKLQHEGGLPATNVALGWESYPLGRGPEIGARSDAEGRFRIAKLAAKPGELRFELAGCAPVLATLRAGETRDLGTIVLPEARELSGRLVSRWLDDDNAERAMEGVEVRAFRAGRVLGVGEKQGQFSPGREFSAQVTDGPLELVVSRGGFFFSGIAQPGEILARLELARPRTGIELSLDERTGALDVQLGDRRPREDEAVQLQLDALDPAFAKGYPSVAEGTVNESGVARFALLPLGRQRAMLKIGKTDCAALGEIEIVAGQCTRAAASELSSCVLRGTVRNARGEPVANASIRAQANQSLKGETDAEGRFRFESVSPGTYLFQVSHGDFGTIERRDVRVASAKDPPLEIVLGGWANLVGHVRAHGEPVGGLTVHAQPVNSNDVYNSITDARGTFRLERLPGCRLRVWASDRFMEIHDLAAGEAREVMIEIGDPSLVTFTRGGAPVVDLDGVRALAFDGETLARSEWRLAKLRDGGAELDLPAGRILFDVTRVRSGSNESFLALESHVSGTVELARNAITLESATPWNGPLPRAMLLSIEGREVVSMWGGVIVLAVEVDALGRVTVPCLPPGSRVKLSGFDSRGQRCELTVDVTSAVSVRWP